MDKIALNAMDRHGVMVDRRFDGMDSLNELRSLYNRIKPTNTDYKETVRSLAGFAKKDRLNAVNPTSKIGVLDMPKRMADHKPSLDEIKNRAFSKAVSQGKIRPNVTPSFGHPSRKVDSYMHTPKTASADYEEMVKTAYEDIMDSFEKEAANALGKNIQQRPGAMHSEFMRRGASAGQASNLINDYRGAVGGQRRMEGIMGKHNMGTIYPESIDKVHDSLRKVNSVMRTPASVAQGSALQRVNARRMQHLLPSVKTANEDILGGFEKEAESIGQMAARSAMAGRQSSGRPLGVRASSLSSGGISFSKPSSAPSKTVDFNRLNRETSNWNNGISRNISPTNNMRTSASDAIARNNNSVFKQNNGAYPGRLY